MNYRGFMKWAVVLMTLLLSAISMPSSVFGRNGPDKIYVFRDRHVWCAVRDVGLFQKLAGSGGDPPQFLVDEGQVWLSGGRPIRIEEYRTDADVEWSTTANYSFDDVGAVTAVHLVTKSGDPLTAESRRFAVRGRIYRPEPDARLSSDFFRRATSLADFPFHPLIERAKRIGPKAKICL